MKHTKHWKMRSMSAQDTRCLNKQTRKDKNENSVRPILNYVPL